MKTFATIHAVASNGKGQYLVLQRAKHRTYPGTWNFVTGHIQDEESAEEAALRELKGETNFEGRIIKTTEPFWRDDGEIRWLIVSSLVEITNLDELKIDPTESQNHKWIRPADPLVKKSKSMTLSFQKLGLI